jgi:hypothetical protein
LPINGCLVYYSGIEKEEGNGEDVSGPWKRAWWLSISAATSRNSGRSLCRGNYSDDGAHMRGSAWSEHYQ